jgi:hypothetical protein
MLTLALAVRFSLEICLAAIALWFPWHRATGITAFLGSAALLLALGLLWGSLLSPRRPIQIGASARLLVELALFGVAAAALAWGGHWQLAAALIIAAFIDKLALVLLEGRV